METRSPHRLARLFWLLCGAALIVRTGVRDRGVIYDHLEFGRRLIAGDELYAPYLDPKPLHPVYPPSFGLLTWPFTLLPDALARVAWGTLQVVALAWIGLFLARHLERHWPKLAPRVHLVLALTAALSSRYVLRDTHGGGGNLINVALVLGAVHLAGQSRMTFAAFVLGVSLATKPTAVLFVPVLWMFGYRRAALGSLGVAAGLLGLALTLHGHGLGPLRVWLDGTVAYARMPDLFATPDGGFPPFTWMNQCLRCAVVRYLGEVDPALAAEVPGFVPGLGWSETTTSMIRAVLSVSILAITFWRVWRSRNDAPSRLPLLAAVFAASLLLSPISWKAHHVALIPALFLLSSAAVAGRRSAWWLGAIYAVTCVAGEELVGKQFKNVQQSTYLVTFGTLALWLACLCGRDQRTDS